MRLMLLGEGLARPNVCALCNTTPSTQVQRVIDTGFNSILPGTDVVGRKYVCESCGLEIANKLGFVSNKQAQQAFKAAKAATERLDNVRQKVSAAAEEISQFAKDVVLGNEREELEVWLAGEFKENVEKVSKAVGRPRKQAVASDADGANATVAGSEPVADPAR